LIPEGVTKIEIQAFAQCDSLKQRTLFSSNDFTQQVNVANGYNRNNNVV